MPSLFLFTFLGRTASIFTANECLLLYVMFIIYMNINRGQKLQRV